MATDKLQINEGTSGKYVPAYTITEDAGTKYLGRTVMNSRVRNRPPSRGWSQTRQ